MKRLFKTLIYVLIAVMLVLYIPYYINTCDDCEKFFVGPGYEPNVVSELISEDEVVLCKECAEIHHALSAAVGKDVSEYMRPIFVDPVTMFTERFDINK